MDVLMNVAAAIFVLLFALHALARPSSEPEPEPEVPTVGYRQLVVEDFDYDGRLLRRTLV